MKKIKEARNISQGIFSVTNIGILLISQFFSILSSLGLIYHSMASGSNIIFIVIGVCTAIAITIYNLALFVALIIFALIFLLLLPLSIILSKIEDTYKDFIKKLIKKMSDAKNSSSLTYRILAKIGLSFVISINGALFAVINGIHLPISNIKDMTLMSSNILFGVSKVATKIVAFPAFALKNSSQKLMSSGKSRIIKNKNKIKLKKRSKQKVKVVEKIKEVVVKKKEKEIVVEKSAEKDLKSDFVLDNAKEKDSVLEESKEQFQENIRNRLEALNFTSLDKTDNARDHSFNREIAVENPVLTDEQKRLIKEGEMARSKEMQERDAEIFSSAFSDLSSIATGAVDFFKEVTKDDDDLEEDIMAGFDNINKSHSFQNEINNAQYLTR